MGLIQPGAFYEGVAVSGGRLGFELLGGLCARVIHPSRHQTNQCFSCLGLLCGGCAKILPGS